MKNGISRPILLTALMLGHSAIIAVLIGSLSCSSKTDTNVSAGNEKNFYLRNCASCHGTEGGGTAMGNTLRGRRLDANHVKNTILNGSQRMPRFNLSDPFLTDFSQWIHDLK